MGLDIPIIINNFNRLSSTTKLCQDFERRGYSKLHIIDNGSTYSPLLDWYDSLSLPVERTSNHGSLALWNSGYINKFQKGQWIAYTDSDLELNPNMTEDWADRFIGLADKWGYNKIGVALQIEGLDIKTDYGRNAVEWEKKFWEKELEPTVYDAQIDTTLSLFRVGTPFDYKALRVAGPFTAKHIPWEVDWENLSEEEQYFLTHSSPWSTYKREYVKYWQQKTNIDATTTLGNY